MTEQIHPLIDLLKGFSRANRRDTFSMIQAANMAQSNAAMQHNRRRMEAQVDAALKAKCGDLYEAPNEDESMGNMFLNSPIIGDDAIRKLAALVNANATAGSNTDLAGGTGSTQQPTPAPLEPQLSQLPGHGKVPVPSTMSKLGSWVLGKFLPLALASGIGVAAAKYFAPTLKDTDTDTIIDIDPVPWKPNQ
jgi:hypothetical protein